MSDPSPIIGGTPVDGDDAVVLIEIAGGVCTGTLIAPEVVVTAAHCTLPGLTLTDPGVVSVGPGDGSFVERAAIAELVAHPAYQGQGVGADLGLARLASPLTPRPLPYRHDPLPDPVGRDLRVLGYGLTEFGAPDSAGRKHQVTLEVRAEVGEYLIVGQPDRNTCQGDSGGPGLAEVGGVEAITAVISFAEVGCAGDARLGRIDPHAAWIDDQLAAWCDGPDCPAPDPGCCAASAAPDGVLLPLGLAVALLLRRRRQRRR